MHISVILLLKKFLIPNLLKLKKTFFNKSLIFKKIIKIGRTHLQDATPLTLGQEISAWVSTLENDIQHIKKNFFYLKELAIGGTSVGTGLNTHPKYTKLIIEELSFLTKQKFTESKNKFQSLSTCNVLVHTHGSLKGLSTSLMKIVNDIRWLSSGPNCGIGEILIPENEPGSSMMPGKVNPTQCEAMMMICCQIISNDVAINIGGSFGNFQLNTYRPMIIYNLLQSINLLSNGIKSFTKYCAKGIKVNRKRINNFLNKSLMLSTILTSFISYDKVEKIVQTSKKEKLTLRESAIKLKYFTSSEIDNFLKIENMINNYKL